MSSPSAPASSASSPRLSNFINGAFVAPVDGAYMPNINPATSQIICEIPASKRADIDVAVAAAQKALPAWKALSYEQRADFLDRIAEGITRRSEEMARVESEDSGKALSTARRIDIPRATANFKFFAGAVRHDELSCTHMADALNYSMRTPVGIAGLITPWNLPIYLLSWKVAPALAMGNVVIAKPSELTPRSASMLAEICSEVGLPAGVLNIVHGLGGDAGQALCEHPDVNLVSFTGGTVTGRRVAATAAPLFKKLSLELGGKNATIVFDDCDFEMTVKGAARAAFTNAGQVCLAGSRIFVQDALYDRFVAALTKEVQLLRCGDPATADFGCVSSLEHRAKIEGYVAKAVADGAQVLCGGKRPSLPPPFDAGAFYEPTLLACLPATHACSVEEIFGPVATLHRFHTEEEVVAFANNTKYGLAGSVWTADLARAHRVAREWTTGMVSVQQPRADCEELAWTENEGC